MQYVPVSRKCLHDKAVRRIADWTVCGSTRSTVHRGRWRRRSPRNGKIWLRSVRGTPCGFSWTCTGISGVGRRRERGYPGSGPGRNASARRLRASLLRRRRCETPTMWNVGGCGCSHIHEMQWDNLGLQRAWRVAASCARPRWDQTRGGQDAGGGAASARAGGGQWGRRGGRGWERGQEPMGGAKVALETRSVIIFLS